VHLVSHSAGRLLDLIEARIVIEIEQTIDLRRMDLELSRQVGLAGIGFDHRAIEGKLRRNDRRESHETLSALGRDGLGIFLRPLMRPCKAVAMASTA
jgi:hypothetical protein